EVVVDNGGDTKICGGGAVLRCWDIPNGVLPGSAYSLSGEKPCKPRVSREFVSIYRSQLRTVCSK
ncbi:hypothetical protein, partial [Xanthomonas phaseoli]